MTNDDRLPADLLKRKAVVYVRQSSQAQVQLNLESRRRQTTRDARRAAQLRDRALIVWSPYYVQAMSAQCFAWTPHALPAMDATGIICSSSVVSCKRG